MVAFKDFFEIHPDNWGNDPIWLYTDWVVVSNIFYFHPYLGKIPILTNIFQMDWSHQLV